MDRAVSISGGARRGSPIIRQPFSNHNGGHLAFGPDGYLYIGLGDGGSGNDPDHRAQNPNTLLGKFLRIDVNVPDSHPSGYEVPADNPYLDGIPIGALPEIWSIGLRNPWRYSLRRSSSRRNWRAPHRRRRAGSLGRGELRAANRGGRNYGWRNREGAHANVGSLAPAYQPLIDPIHEYAHSQGQSITGGFVYRGRALGATFTGRYFFADFITRRVWSIGLAVNGATGEATASGLQEHTAALGGSAVVGNVSSFGIDVGGELYIVSYDLGRILRLIAAPPTPTTLRIIR